ncbi:ABC transporter permease [Nonomuraea sp. NPDC050153]|uniref:ABC transporter permease n=1 Tax=Nonomuraea sp. NPDC050153 TaxID=3364359 RepID=UPI0037BAE76C
MALLVWEATTRALHLVYFPPPSAIARRFAEVWLSEQALGNAGPSLTRLVAGWAVACVAGIGAGTVIGRLPRLAGYLAPLVHFGRSTPPPALIPLFMALAGIGSPLQLTTIVFGTIWPVLLNTIDGTRHVEAAHLDVATIFGLTRVERLRLVILPAAAPKIFAGLRISVSLALILMVISELVGSTEGIGRRMLEDQTAFDIPAMWASIMLLGLLGFAFNTLFLRAERRILAWHYSATAQV